MFWPEKICGGVYIKATSFHELPRNLYALQGSQRVLHLLRNLPSNFPACHEIGASRFTSGSPANAIRSKSTSKDNIQMPKTAIKKVIKLAAFKSARVYPWPAIFPRREAALSMAVLMSRRFTTGFALTRPGSSAGSARPNRSACSV